MSVIADKAIITPGTNVVTLVSLQQDSSGFYLGFSGEFVRDSKEDPYGDFGKSHTIDLFQTLDDADVDTNARNYNNLARDFAKEIFFEVANRYISTPFTVKDFITNGKMWADLFNSIHQMKLEKLNMLSHSHISEEDKKKLLEKTESHKFVRAA